MTFKRYISNVFVLAEIELRKVRHDSTQVWLRSIQPALWLLVFGSVIQNLNAISTGAYTYLQFLTPGILAQSVMFMAIFYGITVVWERDLGLLNKLLSTPARRSAIVLGKALSAGVRGIFQAIIVIILAVILRIPINYNPLHLLGVFVIVVLFGMAIAGLSMSLASFFKNRERMMGVGQAITMPLFFASNAIYPVDKMPPWLQVIANGNPLSYVVDALRSLMVTNDFSHMPADILGIALSTVILLSFASWAFRRIIS